MQEVFDAAWQAFIVEDKPPAMTRRGDDNFCVYEDLEGNSCAIGLCIPKNHPARDYIGSFNQMVFDNPEWFGENINDENVGDYSILQKCLHDNLVDIETGEWQINLQERRERYEDLSRSYDLTIPGESNG